MPGISQGQTFRDLVSLKATESGKHGALRITTAKVLRASGALDALTVADPILREEATPTTTPFSATVSGPPTFTTGTGGKSVAVLALSTVSGLVAGQYLRCTTPGRQGVYQIDTISGTVKIFAGAGELDIGTGDTVERVTPELWYSAYVPVTFDDMQGAPMTVIYELDGSTSSTRGTSPAFTSVINERAQTDFWPENEPSYRVL